MMKNSLFLLVLLLLFSVCVAYADDSTPESGKNSMPEALIHQISNNPTFTAWLTRWQAANPTLEIHDFLPIEAPQPTEFPVAEDGAMTIDEQEKLYSPDHARYFYFPDPGGEPDQEVWVYDRNENHQLERIGCIGSSSWYDGGFWIDDNQFVILSTFHNTSEECWALIEHWDLLNQQRFLYEAILNCGE